jgi:methionine-rich copper-binding protein CopC
MRLAGARRAAASILVAVAGFTLAPVGVAHAHTELDYSLPDDGTTVSRPLTEVTVAFTDPVTLIGNGFYVLDPSGAEIEPFAVTDDDMEFRLQFDPPLAGGVVGVRYEVSASDGHVIEGGFSFTVAAEPATVPTTAAPTVAPSSTQAAPPSVVATSVTTSSPSTVPVTTAVASSDDSGSSGAPILVAAVVIALAAAVFLVVRARTKR